MHASRHESWPNYSTYNVWQTMLGVTRKLGRDHGVLGELFSTHMSNQLNDLVEDVQRVHKKVHDDVIIIVYRRITCTFDA